MINSKLSGQPMEPINLTTACVSSSAHGYHALDTLLFFARMHVRLANQVYP